MRSAGTVITLKFFTATIRSRSMFQLRVFISLAKVAKEDVHCLSATAKMTGTSRANRFLPLARSLKRPLPVLVLLRPVAVSEEERARPDALTGPESCWPLLIQLMLYFAEFHNRNWNRLGLFHVHKVITLVTTSAICYWITLLLTRPYRLSREWRARQSAPLCDLAAKNHK